MDKVSSISKVEVVRFETTYDDGTLDFYTENVRALCKAFCFNFKIIDQYLEGADVRRYYEIYISTSSFFFEDYRHVIKTFILTCGMNFMYTKTIEMDDDDLLNMPEETFEVENLIVYTPEKKSRFPNIRYNTTTNKGS